MKKLTAISILLVLLSVTAFAQLKVGFSSRFVADAVFFEQATGRMADADQVKGAFDVFSSSALIGNQLRLDFTYTGENFGAYLQLKGDGLVKRGQKFMTTDADGDPVVSFYDVLTAAFGDYKVWGNAWVFEGYAGNTDKRGKIGDSYSFDGNFSDFVDNKLEHFGVVKYSGPATTKYFYDASGDEPAGNGKDFKKFVGKATDTDNLKIDGPYIALGINLDSLSIPLVVEVGSNALFANLTNSMGYQGAGTAAGEQLYMEDPANPGNYIFAVDANGVPITGARTATSASQVAAAFRVSGGQFADFISFDAIYRIKGIDPNTRTEYNSRVTDAVTGDTLAGGQWGHEIGAYVGLDIFSGFKIGVGYTAAFTDDEQFRTFKSDGVTVDPDGATIRVINPVFNGISLNLNFKPMQELDISLNNNLSFAWQTGQNDLGNFSTGGNYIVPMGYNIPGWGYSGIVNNGSMKPGFNSFKEIFEDGLQVSSENTDTVTLNTADGHDPNESKLGPNGNMKNTDQKDTWFALWNTLGVTYNITPRASVQAMLSNNLSVYEYFADKDFSSAKYTTDNFQVGLSGAFNITSNVSFGAGLNVSIWSTTAEITVNKHVDPAEIGEVRLAVPVLFTVSF